MKYYVFKLIAPRPTFVSDMTADERAVMQSHGQYLRGRMTEGKVVVFGPVLDPAGAYGLAIVRLEDHVDPGSISSEDPVIKAALGFRYDVSPMATAVVSP